MLFNNIVTTRPTLVVFKTKFLNMLLFLFKKYSKYLSKNLYSLIFNRLKEPRAAKYNITKKLN